jgi:hypothetical protein
MRTLLKSVAVEPRVLRHPMLPWVVWKMTTTFERTQAVLETRRLRQMLASQDEVTNLASLRTTAAGLLRHFPLQVDIDISASALPGVRAQPKRG